MTKVIDIIKYKASKQSKTLYAIECKEALRKVSRPRIISINYDSFSRDELVDKLNSLENRHNFDMNFLDLVDLFMQEQCPEYSWRFDIFIDKI